MIILLLNCTIIDLSMTQLCVGRFFPDPRHLPSRILHSQRMSGRSYKSRLQRHTPIPWEFGALYWHCSLNSQMEQLRFGTMDHCIFPREISLCSNYDSVNKLMNIIQSLRKLKLPEHFFGGGKIVFFFSNSYLYHLFCCLSY